MPGNNEFNIIGNLILKVDNAQAGIKKIQSSLSQLKMPADLDQKFAKSFSNLDGMISRFKNQLNSGFNTKSDVTNITKIGKEIDTEFSKISKHFKELTGQPIDFKINSNQIIEAEKELQKLMQQKEQIAKSAIKLTIQTSKGKQGNITELLSGIQKQAGKTKTSEYAKQALEAYNSGDITGYISAVEKLANAYRMLRNEEKKAAEVSNGIKMGDAVDALADQASKAKNAVESVDNSINKTAKDLGNLRSDQMDKAGQAANTAAANIDRLGAEMKQTGSAAKELGASTYNMSKQLGDLQQSTQYFFSLRNMINLLRQGVDQAIESVKNLDKAMTETAVVTDFSVADMWKDLPKYTKLANELGATTQGAYETMTLYYQQGLDQQATFEIGAETMKMARIAGLDYAQTTDMMTAALRGFNMELNEVSAQRINDVYSNLAAKTASNTQEIGEAMERTASIAHSAGMSFEGTAAFLAQMIETTREAPENLGTAMKTIVARFQELKKNPLEISEVDGEQVDFNKIDAALKTIGVDLVATNGQFRNLDEVFLDISKNWGSLTQMQQRYIATVAAGSRQQSRFIAMVGDYDRTMELMEYANESAGASQEQFNKTLDSFEAKMNRLQNAWQQFTMDIANNTFVKGTVDGITFVLDTVNRLIDTLSGGSGVVKSFLSLFTAFTGLKVAGRVINGLVGGLGSMLDPTTKGGFGKGMQTGAMGMGANRITTPIVSKLSDILNAINNIKNKGIKSEKTNNAKYEERKNTLKDINKGNKIGIAKVQETFKGLSPEDQARLFQANRGTVNAIQRSAYQMMNNAFKDNPKIQMLGKTIQSDIFKGMEKNAIKPSVGIKALGNPAAWGAITGTETARQFSTNYQAEVKKLNTQAADYAYKMLNVDLSDRNGEGLKRLGKQGAFLELFKKESQKLKQEQFGAVLGQLPAEASLSTMDKFANAAGSIGDAFIGAGQSISSFGFLLNQLGGPIGAVGSGLQSLGGIVTNLGMSIGGIGSAISGAQTAAAAMELSLGAIAGPLAAIAVGLAAIGIVIHRSIKQNEEIKKSAKEVADVYDKTAKRIEKNRTTLKNFQGDWERLSQGVDSNGMNVSLESADYDRYQEMVEKIADINPDIIEGFNSQGKAIITNNKALEDTLRLLEQQEKKARKTYTSDSSFEKVIAARNINKDYRKGAKISGVQRYNTIFGTTYGVGTSQANAPMQGAVQSIADTLNNKDFNIDVDKVLSRYNISLKQIQDGEAKAIKAFVKNQESINADIQTAAAESGEKATEFYSEELEKSFSSLSKDTAKFNKAIQPTVDLLAARLTDSQAYKDIAPEMRTALMSGLEDIAGEDKNYKDIISDAESFATELGNITAKGTEYAEAMEIAEEAQNNFADTLDVNAYTAEAEKAITKLEDLEEQYANSNASYADALREHLQNQINSIRNFTEEGTVTLVEALNTMTYKIQAAESAFENFQEATKTDYSTAAQGMKSIYDEIFKETELENGDKAQLHLQGRGDRTFQTGAISLLGRDVVADVYKNKSGVEAEQELEKRLKKIEPMLREGAEGAENFWNTLINDKNIKKIDGINIDEKAQKLAINSKDNPEAFHQLALELGMSDDLLTSMLNKLNQFGDVSFSNIGDVRKALSVDEGVIGGLGTEENGQKKLYVRRSHLESSMSEAGYSLDQMAQEEKNLEKEGNIVIIDKPVELSKTSLEDMGITDLRSAVQVLGDTGQYSKEEIMEVAEKFGATPEDFNPAYQEYLDSSQDPSLPTVQSIEGTVQDIYSLLASHLISEGNLDNSNKKSGDFKKSIEGEEGTDTISENFAKGLNGEGKLLTLEQYQDTFNELGKERDSLENYRQQLELGLEKAKAEGNENQIKLYEDELGTVNGLIQTLGDQLVEGSNAFGKIVNEAKEIQTTKTTIDQEMKKNKAYNADGFKENKKGETVLDKTNFSNLIDKIQDKYKGDSDKQSQVAGQYLQNQSKQLVEANASNETIAKAISDAAAQMREQNFKPQEIVEAINQGFGTNFQGNDFDYKTGKLAPEADISNLQEQLQNLQAKVVLNVSQINLGTSARGRNNPQSAFHRIGTMARGSRKGYTISGRPTLLGEEGEEIVWEPNNNEAYIVGSNGPQLGNISNDAVVWNAEQTKRIKKNGGSTSQVGTGARGINRIGTMAQGSGSKKINGSISLDANAEIKEVIKPKKVTEIPVKGNLEINKENGGLVNKVKNLLFGGNEGKEFAINVTGKINKTINETKAKNNQINAIAKISKAVKAGKVAGEPVSIKAKATVSGVDTGKQTTMNVGTKVDTKNVTQATNTVKNSKTSIPIDANTSAAESKFNALKNKINGSHASLNVSINQVGNRTVTIEVRKHNGGKVGSTTESVGGAGYKGSNNNFSTHSVLTFASAAKGKGLLGPKGRGGLTLTGEKGYEVAWIPSENRSMVLGANGPQMLNLPADAVVWTHEQSKKILKQKSIPAGSQADGPSVTAGGMDFSNNRTVSSNTVSNSVSEAAATVSQETSSTAKKVKSNSDKIKKDVSNAVKAVKAVSVWWENMGRKAEGAQRKMENSATAFEEYLKEMKATLKKTGQPLSKGGGGGDDYIKNITSVLGYAKKEFSQANKELNTLDKGTKAQRKASKKSAKARAKANKKAYISGAASGMEISYEAGKGKKKKTKIAYVNAADYVEYDKKNKTYVINQKKLNKISNRSKRQAVADELNKRIDDRIKKRDSAEDAINKANEALKKMGEELYQNFFAWETELTKIWNLTQEISEVTSRIDRVKSYDNLIKARFDTGYLNVQEYAKEMVDSFSAGIQEQTEKIHLDKNLLEERRANLTSLINQTEDKNNLKIAQQKITADDKSEKTLANAEKARKNADKNLKKAQAKVRSLGSTLGVLASNGITPSQKLLKEYKKALEQRNKAGKAQKEATAALKAAQKNRTSQALSDTERAAYDEFIEETQARIDARNKAWKYMNVSQRADGTLDIDFNTDAFNADKMQGNIGKDEAKVIQDYVKELTEESKNIGNDINTLNSDLAEQVSTLKELQDEWVDQANQLWEISEEEQKNEIEQFKKLSDSIRNAMKNLLDEVKDKLDERRQREDNANTERDISQKQQRLAALRADTSGGHAVEIAQLEKEIADAQQNYTRTLEDQLLDKLQRQADKADEQRERMIELQEALLETANNAALVNKWMSDPTKYFEEIKKGWYAKNAPDYEKMPELLQLQKDKEFKEFWANLTTNQEKQEKLKKGIEETEEELQEVKEYATSIVEEGEKIEPEPDVSAPKASVSKTTDKQKPIDAYNKKIAAVAKNKKIGKDEFAAVKKLANAAGKSAATYMADLAKTSGLSWEQVIKAAKANGFDKNRMAATFNSSAFKKGFDAVYGKGAYDKAIKKKATPYKYATGGLADQTGPAWLDGTPSKPELVLNAKDTKNFIALKDVLSHIMSSANSLSDSYGGNAIYEININVDHLNNDYDVDKVAERVKKKIVQDSGYRNVTQVRKFR